MQFKEDATVYTADNEKVGDIERFVLDPRGQQVIGLIVREGFLFTEDKVVPMDMVDHTEEDKVILNSSVKDPDGFPKFEKVHYINPSESEVLNNENFQSDNFAPLYYYPPQMAGTGWYGGIPVYTDPNVQVAVKERTIPEGAIALKEGANVISRDGEHVGDVKKVHTLQDSDKITHFTISQGMLFETERVVPALWVQSTAENKINLAITSKTLKRLEGNEN